MPKGTPDYTVRIVDANGDPDITVAVIDGISELAPSNGDILQFDAAQGRWVDVPLIGGAMTFGSPVAVGTSLSDGVAVTVARSDHRHAVDSGVAGAGLTLAGGALTVAYAAPAVTLGTVAASGAANTAIRTDATIVAFDATAPTSSAVGDAAATGAATVAARRDHIHGRESFGAVTTVAWAAAAENGVASTVARSDHNHGLPKAIPAATGITIGGTTLTGGAGGITVYAEASQKGVVVRVSATTPGNAIEVQNSGGTATSGFDSSQDIFATKGGVFRIGTTDAQSVRFRTSNTARWDIDASGNLVTVADSTYDIGAAATTRPRDLYLGRDAYTNNTNFLIRTKATLANGAAAGVGTLTNAPASTNPTKWIPIDDNGTTRYVPAW